MTECLVAIIQVVVDGEVAERRSVSHREHLYVRHYHKTLEEGGGGEKMKVTSLQPQLILLIYSTRINKIGSKQIFYYIKFHAPIYPLRLLFSGVTEIARGCGDAQPTLGEVGLLSIVRVLDLNRKSC